MIVDYHFCEMFVIVLLKRWLLYISSGNVDKWLARQTRDLVVAGPNHSSGAPWGTNLPIYSSVHPPAKWVPQKQLKCIDN